MKVCLRQKLMPWTIGVLSMLPTALVMPAVQAQTAIAQSTPATQTMTPTRILSVTGRGIEKIPTSLATVTLGVEVQGKTAQKVQAEVAEKTDAVVKLLKSRKVDELQTQGINLNPNYDYSNNRQVLVGYIGSNTVSFQVPIAQAGELMDEAVESGATRINGISFQATDSAIAAAQKLALKQATEDAQAQAQAVLSALGFQSKEIVGIQVNGAAAPQPIVLMEAAAGSLMQRSAKSPVEGGNQDVAGSVTLQIRY
jgi:uncharacterized protein